MKKLAFTIFICCILNISFSQEKKDIKFDKQKFLKELSDNACICIDSINTFDKIKDSIASEISKCIDNQVGAYQMGIKIDKIKDLEKETKTVDGKKQIDISINFNPNSKEYKEYYYEIERYLNENCDVIKSKMKSNDKLSAKSLSKNSLALEYYNKGLDATKENDFEGAINYYKKAVEIDPEFAFAYDNMGICYRKLENYDEAIKAYEKSLKIDPNGLMPLQNIGVVYIYKKEYKNAIKAYERLGEIQPNNPEVFYGLGSIYAQNLNNLEKGLDNMCKAYLIYVAQKSPYRTDAEQFIQMLHSEFKKQNKLNDFNLILEKNRIKTN